MIKPVPLNPAARDSAFLTIDAVAQGLFLGECSANFAKANGKFTEGELDRGARAVFLVTQSDGLIDTSLHDGRTSTATAALYARELDPAVASILVAGRSTHRTALAGFG